MKVITIAAFTLALFFAGCLASTTSSGFDRYGDPAAHISFEKPANWVQQSDELSTIRFGDLNTSTFAVAIAPDGQAAGFEQVARDTYENFHANPSLFNLVEQNTTLAGFSAVKLTSDQNLVNQTSHTQQVIAADLYIVKDTTNDRILLVSFTYVKDNPYSKNIEEHILQSLKLA